MQICRYLGHGASGIYAIDYQDTPEPKMARNRNQSLLGMPEKCLGFGVDTTLPDAMWKQETYWLRNRWPRIIFESQDRWRLTLQHVIRDGVVIQQTVLDNLTDETLAIDYSIVLDVLIRGLDFTDSVYWFGRGNEIPEENYTKGAGPRIWLRETP